VCRSARLALALSVLGSAGCLHAQTGPTIGFSPGQGAMVGWEAGAAAGPLGGTLGGEFRPLGEKVMELYVAVGPAVAAPLNYEAHATRDYRELFLSTGGTIGLSLDEERATSPLVGGWVGVPWIESGDCRDDWVRTASISAGVHLFFDPGAVQWTVYVTPKLGTLGECPDFRNAIRVD
jgi:hypothetical protein